MVLLLKGVSNGGHPPLPLGSVMRPLHEATKHTKLMEFAGQKYVAKLKISRQNPRIMLLKNYIISHGTTFTEMLPGDIS